MENLDLRSLEKKLDEIIALLKILASNVVMEQKRTLLSTSKKQEIYELCDGTNEINTIAKKAGVSREYIRLTVKDFEDVGLIYIKKVGNKKYPTKVL